MWILVTCVTLVPTRAVKFVDVCEIWFKLATIIMFDEDLPAFLRAALILSCEIFIPAKKIKL